MAAKNGKNLMEPVSAKRMEGLKTQITNHLAKHDMTTGVFAKRAAVSKSLIQRVIGELTDERPISVRSDENISAALNDHIPPHGKIDRPGKRKPKAESTKPSKGAKAAPAAKRKPAANAQPIEITIGDGLAFEGTIDWDDVPSLMALVESK